MKTQVLVLLPPDPMPLIKTVLQKPHLDFVGITAASACVNCILYPTATGRWGTAVSSPLVARLLLASCVQARWAAGSRELREHEPGLSSWAGTSSEVES